jgi:hypothetical protein
MDLLNEINCEEQKERVRARLKRTEYSCLTLVRIEILREMAQKLVSDKEDLFVTGYSS